MEFRVLGPIEVIGEGGPVPLGGEKPRAVLAALLLRRNRAVSSDALVDAVWEQPPATASHAVAVYVSRLRAAIASTDPGRQPLVTRGNGYAVEIEPDELDLERFRRLAAQGRAAIAEMDWQRAWTTLGAALETWQHTTPLACLTTCPVAYAREELEDERLSALEDRFDAGLRLGLHGQLVQQLNGLTREHPERERLWAAFILALYRSGRQGESLQTFLDARRQLIDDFGVEPGPGLRELQRQILDHDPALDLAGSGGYAIALPAPPSSFIGRQKELRDAAGLATEPDVRLLTVVGPGGIGKTRFAIELARRLAPRFRDGIAWVGLDAVDHHTRVCAEIAASLGAGGTAATPLDGLRGSLGDKRMLLVLDCFEHVLPAATDVYRLLEGLPRLSVLATSRERLGLSGEHLFSLAPLAPKDAARLFIARARAVTESSPPVPEVVAEVCERLDRLPLAIELVASQLDARSPAELRATLTRVLDLDGRRDPPARHHTLRSTLDWSHALLDEQERRVLRRLAVFAGGFDVDAGRAVADATRDGIDGLAGKSLVAPHPVPGRYRLLDTVRAYALERLEQSGEKEETHRRHAAWFREVARGIEPESYSSASAAEHHVFTLELPNFRLALRHAVEHGDGRAAATIVRSLAAYLYRGVAPAEGREIARATLGLPGADPIDRGHVLYYDACLSMDMGLADETRSALAEAESLFGTAGDVAGLSRVENLRCFHEAAIGDYAAARVSGERAIEHARGAGSEALEANAREHLVFALLGLGSCGPVRDDAVIQRSLELAREAVDRAERLGGPLGLATAHGNIVPALLELGFADEAAVHLSRALMLDKTHEFGFPYSTMSAARLAGRRGDHQLAIRLLVPCLDDLASRSIDLQAYGSAEVETIYAEARAALGAKAVAAEERAARQTTVSEARDLALTYVESLR